MNSLQQFVSNEIPDKDSIHGVFIELSFHTQWTEVICGIDVMKATVFLGFTGE
jgi:hypothetical protein